MQAEGFKHKILLLLVTLTIIGEGLSIILWTTGFGTDISLIDLQLGIVNAAIMVPLNLIALLGIIKGKKWGLLFLIAISIANRLWSQLLFIGGIHLIFVTWTALLAILAFSEYKGLSNLETGVLSVGMLLNFGLSVLLFNPFESLTSGLLFYSLFMVFLVGAIIVHRKLR